VELDIIGQTQREQRERTARHQQETLAPPLQTAVLTAQGYATMADRHDRDARTADAKSLEAWNRKDYAEARRQSELEIELRRQAIDAARAAAAWRDYAHGGPRPSEAWS
jgi:hypothetical protein